MKEVIAAAKTRLGTAWAKEPMLSEVKSQWENVGFEDWNADSAEKDMLCISKMELTDRVVASALDSAEGDGAEWSMGGEAEMHKVAMQWADQADADKDGYVSLKELNSMSDKDVVQGMNRVLNYDPTNSPLFEFFEFPADEVKAILLDIASNSRSNGELSTSFVSFNCGQLVDQYQARLDGSEAVGRTICMRLDGQSTSVEETVDAC